MVQRMNVADGGMWVMGEKLGTCRKGNGKEGAGGGKGWGLRRSVVDGGSESARCTQDSFRSWVADSLAKKL